MKHSTKGDSCQNLTSLFTDLLQKMALRTVFEIQIFHAFFDDDKKKYLSADEQLQNSWLSNGVLYLIKY